MAPIEIQDGQEPADEKQTDRDYHPKINLGGAAAGIKFRHPIAFLVYGHTSFDYSGVTEFLRRWNVSPVPGAVGLFPDVSPRWASRPPMGRKRTWDDG
jgi:hypothetical protein